MQTIDSYTASNLLHDGEIIIYPTESIYGIGCDPWNESSVNKIYEIKNRPSNKPMIIVGSDIAQIEKLVDVRSLNRSVIDSWPGHSTWLIPSDKNCPPWLKDAITAKVAIRISEHETVKKLCIDFGKPLISTSANLSEVLPSKDKAEIEKIFSSSIEYIVEGSLGGSESPSIIRDMLTGEIVRSSSQFPLLTYL